MAFTNKKGLSEEEIIKEAMKGGVKLAYCLVLLVLTFYIYIGADGKISLTPYPSNQLQ